MEKYSKDLFKKAGLNYQNLFISLEREFEFLHLKFIDPEPNCSKLQVQHISKQSCIKTKGKQTQS